jgi:DivIVA domain-containing protein
VLNPESIRNASFSLMPTGYNPEQVDDALNAVAERLVAGEDIFDLVGHAAFEVADVGYAQAEVDHFFAELAEQAGTTADQPVEDESPELEITEEQAGEAAPEQDVSAAEEPAVVESAAEEFAEQAAGTDAAEAEADQSGDEPADEPALDDDEQSYIERDDVFEEADEYEEAEEYDEADGEYVGAPPELTWQAPTAGVLDLDVLGEAVDRTAETLGSLRGFIDNEIVAMKLAVERQAQETAKRCEQLLHEASCEATALTESVNAEISRARKAAERQAERDRRQLAKELKQARAECDAEVTAIRKDAEAYAAKVRADADRDRAEAQRTIENAIGMQASIAESLERARQQLTPAQADDIAA